MDLSPNDIRNYEFPSQMRGYDKEEVDNLLEQVAMGLEEARQQNLKLSMEVDSLKTQLAGLKEFEDSIKNAAIDARRNADATIANAKKEAEEILARAHKDVEAKIATHQRDITEIQQKLEKLEQTKRSYFSDLRGLINSHLDMIDEIATADVKREIRGDSPDESDANGLEVTESSDMTRQKMETLADKLDEKAGESEEADTPDRVEAEAPQVEQAPKPVDPELAAALEQYKAQAEKRPKDLDPEDFGPAPPQGAIVETDKRAEDIPPGFIARVADTELKAVRPPAAHEDANNSEESAEDEEDTSGLSPDAQDRPTEHNAIDIDQPTENEKAKARVTPDDLAEALDSVVTKFEEEMDKAEKS